MSASPREKKKYQNSSGIFKPELEPASHQKESCHSWEQAQQEAMSGGMASVSSSQALIMPAPHMGEFSQETHWKKPTCTAGK